MDKGYPFAIGFGALFWFLSILRNAYGELSRALGMCLILALQRTSYIRRRYPTWPHVKSSLGVGPRRPFPREDRKDEYQSVLSLVAMGFAGSVCGGNLPLLPAWMGALIGAGTFVVSATPNTAQGDLARTMGMRVVTLVEEVIDINTELRVVQKVGVVSGKILDKILILDRKHRIKDRIVTGITYMYDQVSRATGQGGENEDDNGGRRGRPRRDGDRRDRDRDDRPRRDDRDFDGRRDSRDEPRDRRDRYRDDYDDRDRGRDRDRERDDALGGDREQDRNRNRFGDRERDDDGRKGRREGEAEAENDDYDQERGRPSASWDEEFDSDDYRDRRDEKDDKGRSGGRRRGLFRR